MAVDFPASSLDTITAPQFCAAQALASRTTADLSEASGLSESASLCANRIDEMPFMKLNSLFHLRHPVETAAVVFIDGDAATGAGAQLRQR